MKTLEQLAREAGMADDSGYWLSIFVGKPSEVSLKALARFRAACRAEALEEAAEVCDKIGAATWWPNEAREVAEMFAHTFREMK